MIFFDEHVKLLLQGSFFFFSETRRSEAGSSGEIRNSDLSLCGEASFLVPLPCYTELGEVSLSPWQPYTELALSTSLGRQTITHAQDCSGLICFTSQDGLPVLLQLHINHVLSHSLSVFLPTSCRQPRLLVKILEILIKEHCLLLSCINSLLYQYCLDWKQNTLEANSDFLLCFLP